MKINISTLITDGTYSTCLIKKVGWLHKRGKVNINFQKAILCSERQSVLFLLFFFWQSIVSEIFVDYSPLVKPTFLVISYQGWFVFLHDHLEIENKKYLVWFWKGFFFQYWEGVRWWPVRTRRSVVCLLLSGPVRLVLSVRTSKSKVRLFTNKT